MVAILDLYGNRTHAMVGFMVIFNYGYEWYKLISCEKTFTGILSILH